jgi:hypothetical protein
MPCTTHKRLALGILGLALAVVTFSGQASAQATGDRAGTGPATGTTTRTDRDDSGFNPGWLGLIGLAGLAGLMRKNHTVTTHRTGDASGR